ncbi:MAG TPA: hypothetical protein VMX58_03355 [Patescibacteria group bacterium]|nr:hypothetical protein [Patescibacteria group bacterium]
MGYYEENFLRDNALIAAIMKATSLRTPERGYDRYAYREERRSFHDTPDQYELIYKDAFFDELNRNSQRVMKSCIKHARRLKELQAKKSTSR